MSYESFYNTEQTKFSRNKKFLGALTEANIFLRNKKCISALDKYIEAFLTRIQSRFMAINVLVKVKIMER